MRETKTEAKTIQDAVEKGLAELGLRRDQVEVVVVSEGKSGFLGIGAKKACVVLREKRWASGSDGGESRPGRPSRGGRRDSRGGRGGDRGGRSGGRGGDRGGRSDARSEQSSAPRRPGRYGYEDARLPPQEASRDERPSREGRMSRDGRMSRNDRVYNEEPLGADYIALQPAQDPVEHAKTALLKMLTLMGIEATIAEARLDTAENLLTIKFDCPDSAVFTEENGRGLQSLQFVLNSIVSRKREPHLALRLDTGGYWDSKEREIADHVEETVREARSQDKPCRMDPMPASMRKIVHNLIKTKYPDMETVSEGEGRWRKVVVRKADKPQEPQAAAQPVEQQELPAAGTEEPAAQPEVKTEQPEAQAEQPEAQAEQPEARAEQPEAKTEQPAEQTTEQK